MKMGELFPKYDMGGPFPKYDVVGTFQKYDGGRIIHNMTLSEFCLLHHHRSFLTKDQSASRCTTSLDNRQKFFSCRTL